MQATWAVGLMTGTVLDGNIDVALIRTDGRTVEAFGDYALKPYDEQTNQLLQQATMAAQSWQFAEQDPEVFALAERQLTLAQAHAVQQVVEDAGLSMCDIGVVGFHGQTVLHRAPTPTQVGATRQLGDGALMARTLDCTVVHDFRSADVAAGGQGAPLSAIYHQGLLESLNAGTDTAVLNLGGVANLSWTDHAGNLVAFDTGPANAPLNDFIASHGLGRMDRDGQLAATGKVDEDKLQVLLQHPYLQQTYPKSLDRFDFSAAMAQGLDVADGAALLTAFTAAAVGKALDLLPVRPSRLIVCGGGRHNPVLMKELCKRAAPHCELAEAFGWRGDAIEAECFGYLAMRVLGRLPLSFPSTTGVPAAMTGGVISQP
ncbi:anhydro-N-acetylmuramic acid kinase [Granulosicoccus antarcticus]|uniref:Anhydro-N-acetylmuramic acid kinase n=1 Tax=Granulosicoccus antarcticus IMCC3135 TaxID=1192854 RepID=A0A2Z2NNP6_9GAMM|nr:anhydro-N-acetylmuramic acid kinase [Granulosicoccus antarcticus]ASJ73036.1 Anhydro-N-acetylmuramic acid kinase [Granulosicoccus antarcticus IMCC3135]